ncbi:hypothetical protein [Qipengyuania aquimaris]|uniref:hypothetical protein n=1 Tax=Qipengyuania aquimaris TaxID=255984 RepID=UPI001CD4E379|nr:hypothetical protein [Qipengyuania aquimaris]MCA0903248.1 hypothetical protein [Qipengyuania aquimaris]
MNEIASGPDNDNLEGESLVEFTPAAEGPFSSEKIIERLAKSRDEAARLSNRFFILALLFLGLATIKLAELDLSLTLIGIQTDDLQYGLFFFIVAAQICSVLSTSRTMDSRAYDYQIEEVARFHFPEKYKEAARTVSNSHEWLSPSSEVLKSIDGFRTAKIFYNSAMLVTAIFAVGVVFGPNVLGIYYLCNHDALITEGDKDLQYWSVLSVTVLSMLWSVAYVSIHVMTEGGKEADGD